MLLCLQELILKETKMTQPREYVVMVRDSRDTLFHAPKRYIDEASTTDAACKALAKSPRGAWAMVYEPVGSQFMWRADYQLMAGGVERVSA